MKSINSYLTFNGNCREAMNFYRDCLGGELFFQTIGDSPMSGKMPREMQESIMHASLQRGDLVLMGSDMCPESGLVKGNAVSLVLICNTEEEIKSAYEKLSSGGKKDHPLENTYWGALFGDLTDRYQNHWLLSYEKEKN
jgi:PhnB protein